MRHRLSSKSVSVAGLLLAGLAYASTAEAVIAIIHDFPVFGVVNGTQTARINAVLLPYIEQRPPCPVSMPFVDSEGRLIGDPNTVQLRGGAAAHTDFIGDPNQRILDRLQIRAQVTIGDPGIFPGCAAGVLTSVEVIDKLTHATHVILVTPVVEEVAQ
jgi:hypothetical protein